MSKDNAFENHSDAYERWFERNDLILDSEVEAIRQLLPDSGQGIEIGVGTGIFASRLGILDGVEPSSKMGELAASRGINVISASAEKLPISDGSYQFALMVTVDCFLEDVPGALGEVRRILADAGLFIVAFIDRETALGHQYERRKESDTFYGHAKFHSSEEMALLLEAAGFEVVDKRQTIYSFDNKLQDIRNGTGEGVFAVIKAKKIP